jgi:hypothetical protein
MSTGTCLLAWGVGFLPSGLQAQGTNGVISGTVADPSGGAIAGASVQVKNVASGVTRAVNTNEQGRYRVPDLLVGQYEVQASQTGFQTVIEKSIPLTVGVERVVDLVLPVGQAQQTVNVEGQVVQVDTTSAALATLVEPKQISDLPLNGRNYTQLIQLAPGVLQTPPTFPSGF